MLISACPPPSGRTEWLRREMAAAGLVDPDEIRVTITDDPAELACSGEVVKWPTP